jgi:hypothetical protein
MHPRTTATLRQLDKAAWFSRVGVGDTEAAIVLASWDEAIEHCGSLDWENLCLEAENNYRARLFKRSRDHFAQWNHVATDIRQRALDLVDRKVESVMREHHLPEVFRQTVSVDIMLLCMESEFADVCPPGFFAGQAYWYGADIFHADGKAGFLPRGSWSSTDRLRIRMETAHAAAPRRACASRRRHHNFGAAAWSRGNHPLSLLRGAISR